jgi:hypothetical protein
MAEDGAAFSLGQSLRLISVEEYSKKYEELKQKYKHFVKVNNVEGVKRFSCATLATSSNVSDVARKNGPAQICV